METVNLRKELGDKKREIIRDLENNQYYQEQKLLLAYDESTDLKVLRNVGLDYGIRASEILKSESLILDKFEKEYGEIFSHDMIRVIAVRYNLRLRPTYKYKGVIDNMVAMHIKTFMEKFNLSYETRGYADQFFILAPQKVFNSKNQVLNMSNLNPMLFYKVDSMHYRLIFKWGNDFSKFRYVTSYPFQSKRTCTLTAWFFLTGFIGLLLIALSPVTNLISSFICAGIISFFIAWIFRAMLNVYPDDWFFTLSDHTWQWKS